MPRSPAWRSAWRFRRHAVRPAVADRFEHSLHPWVTYAILPLFALANAGVPLHGLSAAVLLHPVTLGIAFGLLAGKLAGVFSFTWLAVKLGFGSLPGGVSWRHVLGVSLLTGIGFTMSLFLGALAIPDEGLHRQIRLGVLAGFAVRRARRCAVAEDGAKVRFPASGAGRTLRLVFAVGYRRPDRVHDGL